MTIEKVICNGEYVEPVKVQVEWIDGLGRRHRSNLEEITDKINEQKQ